MNALSTYIVSTLGIIWLAVLAVFNSQVKGQQANSSNDETVLFMRAKLASSQKVLEGLVAEDFSLIKKGAEEMLKMSHATRWPQASDKVYEHLSHAFRVQCEKLASQAERGDLQAAHFSYLHMTTNCVDCHNYVRGKFRVERNASNPRGPVRLIPTEWDGPTFRQHVPAQKSKSPPDRN